MEYCFVRYSESGAAALKPELRETAFAFSCEMILADGIVGEAEDNFISDMERPCQAFREARCVLGEYEKPGARVAEFAG